MTKTVLDVVRDLLTTPRERSERLDDVGRALERVRKHRVPLSATLGRHRNDQMVSFYVKSPGGFDIGYAPKGSPSTTRGGGAGEHGRLVRGHDLLGWAADTTMEA
ncbi:MAG: VOC family protein [Marmoricola sp.]